MFWIPSCQCNWALAAYICKGILWWFINALGSISMHPMAKQCTRQHIDASDSSCSLPLYPPSGGSASSQCNWQRTYASSCGSPMHQAAYICIMWLKNAPGSVSVHPVAYQCSRHHIDASSNSPTMRASDSMISMHLVASQCIWQHIYAFCGLPMH